MKSTVWLAMTCSQTGTLGAGPLQSKGQLNLMAREVMTFVQNLGHVEIGLYGDNEPTIPTIRSLLRIILNSRHAMGLGYTPRRSETQQGTAWPRTPYRGSEVWHAL